MQQHQQTSSCLRIGAPKLRSTAECSYGTLFSWTFELARKRRTWAHDRTNVLSQLQTSKLTLKYFKSMTPIDRVLFTPISRVLFTPTSMNSLLFTPINRVLFTPINWVLITPINRVLITPNNRVLFTPINRVLFTHTNRVLFSC